MSVAEECNCSPTYINTQILMAPVPYIIDSSISSLLWCLLSMYPWYSTATNICLLIYLSLATEAESSNLLSCTEEPIQEANHFCCCCCYHHSAWAGVQLIGNRAGAKWQSPCHYSYNVRRKMPFLHNAQWGKCMREFPLQSCLSSKML